MEGVNMPKLIVDILSKRALSITKGSVLNK